MFMNAESNTKPGWICLQTRLDIPRAYRAFMAIYKDVYHFLTPRRTKHNCFQLSQQGTPCPLFNDRKFPDIYFCKLSGSMHICKIGVCRYLRQSSECHTCMLTARTHTLAFSLAFNYFLSSSVRKCTGGTKRRATHAENSGYGEGGGWNV